MPDLSVPDLSTPDPGVPDPGNPDEFNAEDSSAAILYLAASDEKLFIGCVAPADTTAGGLDSLGFFFHLGASKSIVDEHVFVSGASRSATFRGIRQTNIRWPGKPSGKSTERWMKFPISDWLIYSQSRAKSSLSRSSLTHSSRTRTSILANSLGRPRGPELPAHRHYELELDLRESGIHLGVPFRGWLQVETDPETTSKGHFVRRRYLGQLGAVDNPQWFRVEASEAASLDH